HQVRYAASVRSLRDGELDLLAPNAAPDRVPDGDADAPEPQPSRQRLQPMLRRSKRKKCSQGHVAGDAGCRVQDRDEHTSQATEYKWLRPGRATRRRY